MAIGAPHKAMLLPQAAIGNDQGKKYVLVVNKQNVVEYRPIITGPQQPDGMQVVQAEKVESEGKSKESLTPNDLVITGGLQKIRPGDQVTVREGAE
jgi:multidrug efflux system membrane fusion protein